MPRSHHHRSVIVIILLILGMTLLSSCSERQDSFSDRSTIDISTYCYQIPGTYWPKIRILGVFSAILVFVAITFGVVIYFIGYFAGGRLNKPKILGSIVMATLVALLGRSCEAWLRSHLTAWLYMAIKHEIAAAMIVDVVVYIFWTAFIAGIAVYTYETFVVTAKEAHPMG